ncbi:MAG: type II toxin-antitoxin system VapC family toxin [Deltaproteobacteria bacterium]|nr:type II toxin-antitoxin system VapC family toxin [Deltaproteobacteria bacterium]
MALSYIDTSALAKWYLPEIDSEVFSEWMLGQDDTCISSLTVTEFRCLLARRRRMEMLNALEVQQIYAKFKQDIEDSHLINYPVENRHILNASLMIESLPSVPLRTLDALHLTIANDIPVKIIATADKVMGQSAQLLDFEVVLFG